jgi:hypothetical protein
MKTKYLTLVRKMFVNDLTPIATQRHNMRAWVNSVRHLGAKWIALPMQKPDVIVSVGSVFAVAALAAMGMAGMLPGAV